VIRRSCASALRAAPHFSRHSFESWWFGSRCCGRSGRSGRGRRFWFCGGGRLRSIRIRQRLLLDCNGWIDVPLCSLDSKRAAALAATSATPTPATSSTATASRATAIWATGTHTARTRRAYRSTGTAGTESGRRSTGTAGTEMRSPVRNTPAAPTPRAAPADAAAQRIAAPIPTRTVPAVPVPAVLPATEEELDVLQ
jgi:hypothetical protein